MDSAKYVTQLKRINLNIGKKIQSKMCNTVDLINNNISREYNKYRSNIVGSNINKTNAFFHYNSAAFFVCGLI